MILIFGGTGFIGRNMAIALEAEGIRARAVSRQPDRGFLADHAPEIEPITLEQFHADPATALFGCTSVVYLAGTSTPASNVQTPWRELPDNVEPLLRVLRAVQDNRPEAHVVFVSSGGTVYGPSAAPLLTEDTPLHPISAYGLGKKMMEAGLTYMADLHGMRTTILRPANPIGPWQTNRSQGVVGVLMRAALSGDPFPMLGDGSAVRDYFDVSDLVRGIRAALERPEASIGATFNLGSGQGRSVREMIALVEAVSGQSIAIEEIPARTSDVNRVVLDIARARDVLGWTPEIPLQEALRAIWARMTG